MGSGLSLSFEVGITSKISAVTYKHMGEGHLNKGPKGLSFKGGCGGMPPQKIF